ncbi:hypothetical protein QTG54_014719 [Skeletonema marinoi]|uniref:Uncharacterized protein n=1 Tax=Skeletonema marinoi TaxID=267567 RepID=A0AAD9D5I5_9STRA|nr:hypothetical protein QTG54_014719 [Skeletonema marinoi]
MASAYTTRDDKNEAMQEILILAKTRKYLAVLRGRDFGLIDAYFEHIFRNYSSFFATSAARHQRTIKSYKQGGRHSPRKAGIKLLRCPREGHCAAVTLR